jgi:hypothetical protein
VRLRCVLCRWEGELSELPRRCPACGVEAEALKRVAVPVARPPVGSGRLAWLPGGIEPIVGPSRVPIRRPPLGVLARSLEEWWVAEQAAASTSKRESPPVRVPGQRP